MVSAVHSSAGQVQSFCARPIAFCKCSSLTSGHGIFLTLSIFQELTSIFSFRKRRLKQLKFSENRNKSATKAKICFEKHNNCVKIFFLLTNVAVVFLICLSSLTSEDGDGNIRKAIRLITQDKKCT